MEIVTRAARIHSAAIKLAADDKAIGFVPTRGALHEGHLSLVREARRMCDAVIVSAFAPPTSLRASHDPEYPRDIARDADLLVPLGVDYLFAPSAEEIYPKEFSTWVTVEGLSDSLEGAVQPGFFRKVATGFTIFFNLIHPKFVFMGQKDAQQTVIAKKLVRDLHLPVEIIVLPMTREDDGLVMSARNQFLSPNERQAAPVIYRALQKAEQLFTGGERHAGRIVKAIQKEIANEPLARVEYIAVTDSETLAPLDNLSGQSALVSIAVHIGNVRLIDNVILDDTRYKSRTGRLKLG
jgi:pantoate--beta-alanine ligase